MPVLDANIRLTNSSLTAAAAELLNSSDQFLGARIRVDAPTTNLNMQGATLLSGTASKVVVLNSSKGLITSSLDAAALTNLADVLGPIGAELALKASRTELYGETNLLWLRAKGPWVVATDPTTIDLSIPRQRIIITGTFAPSFINTNNGESCVLSIEAATPQTVNLPVNYPEGSPSTNNWSGTNRFYIEVVGAAKRVDCYFSAGLIAGVINSSLGKGTNTMLWMANLRSSTNVLTALNGRISFEGAMGDTNYIYSSDEGVPILLDRFHNLYTNQAPMGAQLLGWNSLNRWFARKTNETLSATTIDGTATLQSNLVTKIYAPTAAATLTNWVADFKYRKIVLTPDVITNGIHWAHSTNHPPAGSGGELSIQIQTGNTNIALSFAPQMSSHIVGTNTWPVGTILLSSNYNYFMAAVSQNGTTNGVFITYPIAVPK